MKNLIMLLLPLVFIITACGSPSEKNKFDFSTKNGNKETLNIVAGSENKELEPILNEYAKKSGVKINVDYLGSLDIMKLLKEDNIKYDAVWPASSIWLNTGDTNKVLKHVENTSFTPITFGIKKSKAEELGFVGKDVMLKDIQKAISDKKLKFTMTSASQSNSGASAYLSFLSAFSKNGEVTDETLKDKNVQKNIKMLLSGVNRSSGSSHFLIDVYLKGNYDAMVNYESMIIQTNKLLEKEGKEPLYMVYPKDGVAVSDSPLAYVDKKDKDKEKTFKDFQTYILKNSTQSEIEKTGKRSVLGQVKKENQNIYKKEWGIDLNKTLNQTRFPNADTIMSALNIYQTQFKKPSLTFYVMDYSGSMQGEGKEQMTSAIKEIFITENAKKNLLQGTPEDLTFAIPFDDEVMGNIKAVGNSADLEEMYHQLSDLETRGGTNVYVGLEEALKTLNQPELKSNLDKYMVSIVVMSDGETDSDIENFTNIYKEKGLNVPIYSIMYGSANEEELSELAELSNAKVFDGRKNLIKAFQQVRGYN